jgi:hypothetical protein
MMVVPSFSGPKLGLLACEDGAADTSSLIRSSDDTLATALIWSDSSIQVVLYHLLTKRIRIQSNTKKGRKIIRNRGRKN